MSTDSRSDQELLAAVRSGDRDAFVPLVVRHQQMVCALAFAHTGSFAVSEDVAQETFLAAWRRAVTAQAPENFRAWLCGTVRNLAARFHRDETPSAPLAADVIDKSAAAPREQIALQEDEALVWAALSQLPATYREPLVLYFRQEQSVREVAAALELTEVAVRQRLSRGRALLQEAVRGRVESALIRSAPGEVFTFEVMSIVPALAASLPTAGAGVAVAKGAGSLAASGVFSMLGGMCVGFVGAWFGMKSSLDRAESKRERRFIVRVAWRTAATIAVYMAALLALIYWAGPIQAARPGLWIGLMGATVLSFAAVTFLLGYLNTRAQQRIRVEERLRRGLAAVRPGDECLFEYRSSREFLGLPLVHVRLGGCSMHVAKGWIAYGNIAISPLLAVGGIAVGGISMGGIAVGAVAFAGIGLGLFSFSGLAVGGLAIGGLAAGWLAMGGAAWGWLAALGGQAWAGLYAMGHHVVAPHANDAVAKAFFNTSGLAQAAGWLAEHGWWVQWGVFLPVALVLGWIRRRLQRPAGR